MTKSERVFGFVFIPLQSVVLPILLWIIYGLIGFEPVDPYDSLIYYAVSFFLVLVVMFRFLKASFSDFIGGLWNSIKALILGYILYRVLLFAASLLLARVMGGTNPNQEAVIKEISSTYRVMIVVTVILAPIVEEPLFRGVLFGVIRQKNRALAYIISVVLFCVFHLWAYIVFDFSWDNLLYLAQYVPASIALAWCYERSGTIWTPIILHAVHNLLSTLQYKS